MPEGQRAGTAVRDLLLVVVVAGSGLFLGVIAQRSPDRAPSSTPRDLVPDPRQVSSVRSLESWFTSAQMSAAAKNSGVSAPAHPAPAVFPFTGQPQSGPRVDLRDELSRMAAQRRHPPAAGTQP